jgi:hypothetical protein
MSTLNQRRPGAHLPQLARGAAHSFLALNSLTSERFSFRNVRGDEARSGHQFRDEGIDGVRVHQIVARTRTHDWIDDRRRQIGFAKQSRDFDYDFAAREHSGFDGGNARVLNNDEHLGA